MGWLTTAEVGAEIRTSANYVARQCELKNLKAKKVGNEWRIHTDELRAFMSGDEKTPASRPPLSARQKRRSS